MLKRIVTAAAFGGALAASVAVAATVATTASVGAPNEKTYAPMQSISYVVGSKSAIGYFVQEKGACRVVLMVAENVDPDVASGRDPRQDRHHPRSAILRTRRPSARTPRSPSDGSRPDREGSRLVASSRAARQCPIREQGGDWSSDQVPGDD